MNLTYEVKNDGYTIFDNGKPWIVETSHSTPFPCDTLEESVQKHIDYLIEIRKPKPQPEDELTVEVNNLRNDVDTLLIKQLETEGII